MTRAEFFEEVTTWEELLEFCWAHQCDICDDVYDGDSVDEQIDMNLVDWARDANDWTELRNRLNDLPNIYSDEYYTPDDYYEWRELDDNDFVCYRDDVAVWMDDNDEWDDDESEETEDEEAPAEEEEDGLDCEGISIDNFITLANSLAVVPAPEPKVKEEKTSEPEVEDIEDPEDFGFFEDELFDFETGVYETIQRVWSTRR